MGTVLNCRWRQDDGRRVSVQETTLVTKITVANYCRRRDNTSLLIDRLAFILH
jgi:hypothetical protein